MKKKPADVLDVLDYYLGDDIEEIAESIDDANISLEEDYEQLLKYLYRSIVKAWFDGNEPSETELKKKLERYRSDRYYGQLKVMLNYLINKYVRIRKTGIAPRGGKDDRRE
ncbi:MAG: hypothetical protein GU347_01305 [Desulfurococcales archaeon]|jgi:predicted S18 family serine protease|uniref:Uncharacterized protein n=1 Tax=Fervidicoccus fontis TaxID=683846 RepID=A0A7J3SMF4_9CREN|nr:hypothetical protein [Thermoprotei archaeon]NAY89348.1 hypothetical protein [Desulfurococcales archaeon]